MSRSGKRMTSHHDPHTKSKKIFLHLWYFHQLFRLQLKLPVRDSGSLAPLPLARGQQCIHYIEVRTKFAHTHTQYIIINIKKIVRSSCAWKSFRWNIALWPERRPLSSAENAELLMCTSCRSCDGGSKFGYGFCVCWDRWSLWLFLVEVGRNGRGLMFEDGRCSRVGVESSRDCLCWFVLSAFCGWFFLVWFE